MSAGAPWSRGERGDHSRSQCWAGAEKRREREKVLAEETRAPERETAACYTAPSPQPPGACCGSTLLGLQRILDIFSENCTDFCTHTHVHTQVCFFFFFFGGGGGVGHILVDKNPCYRELFQDPAETSENKANMKIPTSTLHFFAHGRINHGTDSHGA